MIKYGYLKKMANFQKTDIKHYFCADLNKKDEL